MKAAQRTVRALVSGALVVPFAGLLAVPAAADGEQSPPGPQSIEEACAGVPQDYAPFTDVDGNQFEEAILCLAYAKVTRGGAGGAPARSYVPQAEVSRDAMASFVARLMDVADDLDAGNEVRDLPAYDGTPSFTDVRGNTHEAAISRLADAGIVQGGAGGARADQYVPSGRVTRAQMASFLDRALEYLLGEPVSTTDDYYTDDDGVHERSINDVTSVGIATGRSADTYAPDGLVDRDNMAAFLARTLAELEERGATEPLPAPADDDITVVEQDDVSRNALANPDSDATDDRTYTVTGLAAGEEYRVTLVESGTLSETMLGETVFTEDGETGLAAVGTRTADVVAINGAPAVNNTGDGTPRTRTDSSNGGTGVGNATAEGRLSFVVDLDAAGEAVVPVVYRNGGPTNAQADGGTSARLELEDDGTAAESVDTGGAFGEDIQVTPDAGLTRVAVANPDDLPIDDRTYQVAGLVPGEEYRVTVVEVGTTETRDDGSTAFTRDGGGNLAAVGERTVDITSVNGEAPTNNTGDGTTRTATDPADTGTAVFVAAADGTASFVLDLDGVSEFVLPVVYRNGGAGNSPGDGGSSPRLELGADGVPVEDYDVGGAFRAE